MKGRALLIVLAAMWMGGCTTLRPATPPIPDASEYRKVQVEINQQQTELAVTGERIEEGSRALLESLKTLETALADPDYYDRETARAQVKELRSTAEEHQAETEKLNWQLAGEREITHRQGELFDEREEVWRRAVAEREAENAALQVENKTVKGQRNTFLTILITAGVVVVVFIVFKVLRAIKIIPI
jgi:hypothetical protein